MVSSSSFFGYQPPSIRAYEIVLDEVKISEATKGNLCAISCECISAGVSVEYSSSFWSVERYDINSVSL